MNDYTVLWTDEAEDQFFELTNQRWRLTALRNAVREIEARLGRDPDGCEAIHEGLYGINVEPLRAVFEIHREIDVVRIVAIRESSRGH